MRSWDSVLGDHRTGWFAHASNGAVGWGDTLSFGLTSYARQGLGYDDVVDYGSWAYFGGRVVGIGHSFMLGWVAAGYVPATGIWAYRAANWYTAAGSIYGVGRNSYVLITDPEDFGFTDALGFVPLAGYGTRAAIICREFRFGSNFRIAPFGNRTGHPIGRWPHYHRRAPDPQHPGQSLPGQGIGRHRPWETSTHDTSWLDRW